MRRLAVLTVCLLLVLSGCNAFPDGGESTTGGTTTADPTTRATDGTTKTDRGADLPPGLTASGVTDAAALAAAHEDALAGQSYTYDREVTVVAANGTRLGYWTQHAQVGQERLRFNYTQTGHGVSVSGLEISDTRLYTNGSVTFSNASAFRGGYRRTAGRGFAATTFSSEQLLADVLNTSETTVTSVEQEGQTWYRVRTDGGPETFSYERPPVDVRATNITAIALVSSSGFVRNVTYGFDFVRGNVTGHRTMTIRYSAVGETAVEVPAWVADAKTATNATERALTDRLAPGLNETGVTDSAKLADAHASVLRNTSYTVVENLTASDLDGTVRARSNSTLKVGHDPIRLVRRTTVSGEPRAVGLFGYDVEVWATENGTWFAIERANATNYSRSSSARAPPMASRTGRDTLFVLFAVVDTTVSETETESGTTRYRVKSTNVTDLDGLATQLHADSVQNFSLSAVVAESGLVHQYRLEYTATIRGNTTHVERIARFTALGETSVERPPWYEEAANATAGVARE